MIRGLIFDFDGLLVETEAPGFQAWQEIFQAHGVSLPLSLYRQCIGTSSEAFDPYGYLEELLQRPIDRAKIRDRQEARSRDLIARQPLLPGIREIIRAAGEAGLRLAVASSSSRAWVEIGRAHV